MREKRIGRSDHWTEYHFVYRVGQKSVRRKCLNKIPSSSVPKIWSRDLHCFYDYCKATFPRMQDATQNTINGGFALSVLWHFYSLDSISRWLVNEMRTVRIFKWKTHWQSMNNYSTDYTNLTWSFMVLHWDGLDIIFWYCVEFNLAI